LTGVVGAGKTATLRRLQEILAKESRVLVSKSVSVEKVRVTLGTLITALFCDLTTDKELKSQAAELRSETRNLVLKRKKPVVLIVEEAHESTTIRYWFEASDGDDEDGGAKLCVLLSDGRSCATISAIQIGGDWQPHHGLFLGRCDGQSAEYIAWLLASCAVDKITVDDILDPAALICSPRGCARHFRSSSI